MQSSLKTMFLVLVFLLSVQTIIAQEYTDVTVVWNQDILVVINTSDVAVNVSTLDLISANGAIMATDWVMDTYGDSNLSYSLAELEPGSCLVAYPGVAEEQPALPETVECTMIVGAFTMTNIDDVVWDAPQGGFSAEVAGSSVADCDITGSSCVASVSTTASNREDATMVEMDDSEADIVVAWNTDIFVIINTSDDEVNLSNLSFRSSQGTIQPENWVMSVNDDDSSLPYSLGDFEPGSCLIAYLSADEQPELPEDVVCAQTEGVFTMTNINDMVWDASHGGFSAELGETVIADCDINNSTCILNVPTTSAMDDDMDMMDDMTPTVRAVWNTDILVLVNTSSDDVDLSGLSLSSSQGDILSENWVMNLTDTNNLPYALDELAPGTCLVAYLSADEQPELPEGVTCTETAGVFTMTNINDVVWDVSQGGFSAMIDGATVADCDITTSSCDIELGG